MEVSSAKLQRIVKVPKSYIWKRFEAFKEVGSILPPPIIDKVVGESNEVGSLRFLTLGKKQKFPGQVIERLESKFDDSFLVYSIVDKSCLPVRNYIASLSLITFSEHETDVTLSSHWIPIGSSSDEMKSMFEGLYELMFSNIEKQYNQ
ncbi:hypothetical protein OAJ38_02470 [Rhodobiaceae bacterium]|nr:hypothetical protein [Rhodobiaceae bacterium]MDC0070808.1 hypothetical protein [Rhodobiaceae bacterium]|tara:strand:- start:64 stop:507 length:444 start_codon:yes stop_codon:yes gene_type:complete